MNIQNLTKVVKDLKGARKLLENSQGLARKVEARNAANQEVDVQSPEAVKFDPVAAIRRVAGYSDTGAAYKYLKQSMLTEKDAENGTFIHEVSDRTSTKLEHVLMAFDFAILQAETDLRVAKRQAKKQF